MGSIHFTFRNMVGSRVHVFGLILEGSWSGDEDGDVSICSWETGTR